MSNPFITQNNFGTKRQRENSVYIWKVLINIFRHNGSTEELSAEYKTQIMSGKLYNTTKKEDDEAAAKLKALVKALDKDENKQKFLKSYFCAAIQVLNNGSKDPNSNEIWTNYSLKKDSHMQGSVLNNALISYKDDSSAELGIDMNKFLSTIIRKNESGIYEIIDITAEEGDKLIAAVAKTVNIMKKSEKFRCNFENLSLDQENG